MGNRPKQHDAAAQEMQQSLGAAISAWARIEGALCWLFSQAVNPSRTWLAYEVYETIISSEVRLDVTDAAMRASFRDRTDILKRWEAIRKKLITARKLRAKLAHGQIVQTTKAGKTKTRLMPFHYLESHRGLDTYESHTRKQIDSYGESFREIAQEIHELQREVRWVPKPRE